MLPYAPRVKDAMSSMGLHRKRAVVQRQAQLDSRVTRGTLRAEADVI
jgi:hypothetical protein